MAGNRSPVLALLVVALVVPACSTDSTTGPGTNVTGTIRVTVTTTGADPDADGYVVTLDGAGNRDLSSNGSASFSGVAVGSRSIRLEGVASNCTVQDGPTRAVQVSGGASVDVAFAVSCVAAVGTLRLVTTTAGVDVDDDGYRLFLDGADERSIDENGEVLYLDVAVGQRTVLLSDVASNCGIDGPAEVTLDVAHGQSTDYSWAITCGAPASLLVSVGPICEGNLYLLNVDEGGTQELFARSGVQHFPTWSPDGQAIAFTDDACQAGQRPHVFRSALDGTSLVDLGVGADPGWSPDGASILFSAPPDDVWLMAADGADRRPLTDTTDQVTQNNPAWTPDGTQIVFVRWRQEGGTLLNIAAADGSSARLLTPVVDGSTTAARRYRPTVRGSPSAGSLSTQRAAR